MELSNFLQSRVHVRLLNLVSTALTADKTFLLLAGSIGIDSVVKNLLTLLYFLYFIPIIHLFLPLFLVKENFVLQPLTFVNSRLKQFADFRVTKMPCHYLHVLFFLHIESKY